MEIVFAILCSVAIGLACPWGIWRSAVLAMGIFFWFCSVGLTLEKASRRIVQSQRGVRPRMRLRTPVVRENKTADEP